MQPITPDFLEKFLGQALLLEKRYAHEQTGVQRARREELKRLLERMVAEQLEGAPK
ncbi:MULTISPECIES: hypothetical protein [Cupriavidus]|jgi:hypothetical protein|uniref:hypothetical protein n=1 Tax=Cupriavidus TaxID=106589 RepID=UPI0035C6FBD1